MVFHPPLLEDLTLVQLSVPIQTEQILVIYSYIAMTGE